MKKRISYWEPRVMLHMENGREEFAIHEVYFDSKHNVVSYTRDALSTREPSVEILKDRLLAILENNQETIISGDNQYSYSKEDLNYWLDLIDIPPLNFE